MLPKEVIDVALDVALWIEMTKLEHNPIAKLQIQFKYTNSCMRLRILNARL